MISTQLTTADGVPLDADVLEPVGPVVGGVVVCHPHPLYGGDRYNTVVDTLFRTASSRGFRSLRFDFRRDHGGGVAETADVVAALDELERRSAGEPLFVIGYSFGAVVALRTDDARIAAVVAIAPPLSMMPVERPPRMPVLAVIARNDQFCPPDVAESIVGRWPACDVSVVESADHFLVGTTSAVADVAVAWLLQRRRFATPPRSGPLVERASRSGSESPAS